MTTQSDAESHGHGDAGHEPMNIWGIGGYLLILTMATFFTYFLQKWFPGAWGVMTNILFVLMIAFCKASLVVGYFMHFRYEKAWIYCITIPTCMVAAVLVLALLPDMAMHTYPRLSWNARP